MERLLLFVDPKHCPAYNDPVDLLIATIIAISLLVCYVPQHYRIFNTKTSEGINPWFLLYGSVSITCNLFNILILQANKIYVSGRFCFQNTLGIIQFIIQWFMFTIFLILYIAYFPEHKKYISDMSGYNSLKSSIKWRVSRYVAVFVASFFIFTLIVSACLLMFVGKAEEHFITKFWAESLGVLSMIIASIQYLPQIWETWEIKIVGALSIPMLIVQTPGTFLLVYFLAIREGNSWSTWIAFFIAGILQGILLALCIVWYYREKRGISSRSVSEIEAQSSESSEPNESSSLLDPQRVREN